MFGGEKKKREKGSELTSRAARPYARLPRRSSHSLPCKRMPPPPRQMLTFDLRSHASSEVLSLVDLSASSSHSLPSHNFISSSFYARFIATSGVKRSCCPPSLTHTHTLAILNPKQRSRATIGRQTDAPATPSSCQDSEKCACQHVALCRACVFCTPVLIQPPTPHPVENTLLLKAHCSGQKSTLEVMSLLARTLIFLCVLQSCCCEGKFTQN